jgi:ornithine carbamoyltransferase
MSIQPKSLLTLLELNRKEFAYLLSLGEKVKRAPNRWSRSLMGKSLAMIFEKSSTRTRVSFEVGMTQLGGHALYLNGNDLQLGRGETVADTAQVLSRFVDGIMIRTFSHHMVEELAESSRVPVINGLTDTHHPCQALADLMTIHKEFGKLKGLQIVFVGDGNNVAHSLMIAAAQVGAHFRLACPEGYEMNTEVIQQARQVAAQTGSRIETTYLVKGSVKGAQAVYTDVWTSMGQEKEKTKRLKAFRGYQVNQKLMSESSHAIFLHCLPAHRGEEVSAEVIDGPQSRVWDQAENRLHAQKAILITLLGKSHEKDQ